MNIGKAFKNSRLTKALTGLTGEEFNILACSFGKILYKQAKSKKRKRCVGGGRKGVLRTAKEKLFFILFYLKTYPTFDLSGFIFGVDRSQPCRWTSKFLPLLEEVLGHACVLPKRQIKSVEEFLRFFPEVKDLFIDGTERRVQRPKSKKHLRGKYSGKKKTHCRKNIVVADEIKRVLLLSPTKGGRRHDKKLLDKSNWLSGIPPGATVWVDTAFYGIEQSLNSSVNVLRPKKHSKLKPLTNKQKAENHTIASFRMIVENTIAGIKRLNAVRDVYRNKKGQDDSFMLIASGLWNFHLQFV